MWISLCGGIGVAGAAAFPRSAAGDYTKKGSSQREDVAKGVIMERNGVLFFPLLLQSRDIAGCGNKQGL